MAATDTDVSLVVPPVASTLRDELISGSSVVIPAGRWRSAGNGGLGSRAWSLAVELPVGAVAASVPVPASVAVGFGRADVFVADDLDVPAHEAGVLHPVDALPGA